MHILLVSVTRGIDWIVSLSVAEKIKIPSDTLMIHFACTLSTIFLFIPFVFLLFLELLLSVLRSLSLCPPNL